jgi:methyl-accepting chemotaxis protein
MQTRLLFIVTGGLAILLIVASISIASLNGRLHEYQALINDNIASERQINQLNYQFKTQVQEWKNVLLRGYDDSNRNKYWDRFKKLQDDIQNEGRQTVSSLPNGQSRNLVSDFLAAHNTMGSKYQSGFDDFSAADYDSKVGDAAVKGIDREPSKKLKAAANEISREVAELAKELQAGTTSMIIWAEISVILVALLVVAVLSMTLKKSFLSPLKSVMQDIRHFADGDFSQNIDKGRIDELGELARNLGHMQEEIVTIITAVQSTSTELNDASARISSTAGEINDQTGKTDHYMDQVATAMHEMSMTVQEVATNASGAADAAQAADSSARGGLVVMEKTISSINSLSGEVDKVSGAMDKLEADTASVGAVLDVIKGVAEQTNLLALNAAIEAARAGEQGRGFAVVADEVRGLAQRTQESTEEIQQIIETVQSGAAAAVRAMRESKEQTSATVDLASEAGESIRNITESISSIRDMNTQIATAAEEQSYAAEEISKNVVNVTELAQEAHQSSRHASEIASGLDKTSGELSQLITRFKV